MLRIVYDNEAENSTKYVSKKWNANVFFFFFFYPFVLLCMSCPYVDSEILFFDHRMDNSIEECGVRGNIMSHGTMKACPLPRALLDCSRTFRSQSNK